MSSFTHARISVRIIDRELLLKLLLAREGRLPPEIINFILFNCGGIASPSGIAWRGHPVLKRHMAIHRQLLIEKDAATSESRCWCQGFSLTRVLCEIHAFGTSQQVALSPHTVHHSSPPLFPLGNITYRNRCSLASLLTRIAANSLLPENKVNDIVSIENRIPHNVSAPFIPVNIHMPTGAIGAWFVRTFKTTPIGLLSDKEALVCAYYGAL
jgi:hypothetical protein